MADDRAPLLFKISGSAPAKHAGAFIFISLATGCSYKQLKPPRQFVWNEIKNDFEGLDAVHDHCALDLNELT